MSVSDQTPAVVRVVIADDQSITRDGLTTILEAMEAVTVVGVAGDGAEAVAIAQSAAADVVLMDLRMPSVDGIEATRRLAAESPDIAVVVLTTYSDDESILQALRAGARGYLTKNATAQDIHRALLAAVSGYALVDRDVQARVIEHAVGDDGRQVDSPAGLSAREGEVLGLIAEGLSNGEIADRLFISRATVKTHINQILRKTGCRDRPQVILFALSHQASTPD